MSRTPADHRVFGYGSLIFRPDFAFAERREAAIHGCAETVGPEQQEPDQDSRPMPWRLRRFAGALAAACLALAVQARDIALEACFLKDLRSPARCATLAVPEDHAHPEGPTIDLHVAVLPAVERPAQPDPVFVLAGGPGQSATAIAALTRRILSEAGVHRDIVLLDQRGTGRSTPLACEIDFDETAFDDDAKASAVSDCLEAWQVDPRHFTTRAHIEDLERVRRALGYETINLYGGSYGTRAALVYLREYPGSLRTVVLDAVAPMTMRIGLEMGTDAQGALERLFADCAADAGCAARFPALRSDFSRLLDDLEAAPREVTIVDPATGETRYENVDHRAVALGVRALLYSPQTRRALPPAIAAARADDLTPLLGLATAANQSVLEVVTPGLLLAVLCAEDLAEIGPGDIPEAERESFVGTAQVDEFLAFCRAWPAPVRAMDWTPPTAGAPTLLLSGALDPVTPPARAEAAAATLPWSRHIVVPGGGHIVGALGCVPSLIAEFIDSADPAAPDASCVEEIAVPSFFTTLLGPEPVGDDS